MRKWSAFEAPRPLAAPTDDTFDRQEESLILVSAAGFEAHFARTSTDAGGWRLDRPEQDHV